ncbi:MAG: STT3 domain-containing protein [Nanoarchaeota archaeon]
MDDVNSPILDERRKKVIHFVKKNANWFIYIALALVVYIAVWLRTRNLAGLRDITTGGWTLGPDLDPFLFLRYAKEIVETGSLATIDYMRYVPLGLETGDFSLHYYSIAWFHKIASILGSSSVDQSASIFPVVMFALTAIAFFLLSKKIISTYFDERYSSIGAIVSTLLFSLFPVFIPRTIAGIPEKESSAFLFMFLAIYFLMQSWNNSSNKGRIIFGTLAGISTGLMALIWGAYSYIFFIIVPAAFISFLVGNFEKKQIISYSLWLLSALVLMIPFSNRYGFFTTFTSFDRGAALALLLGVCLYHFFYHKIESKITRNKTLSKVPSRLLAMVLFGFGLVLIASILLGPGFIINRFDEIYSNFVKPATSRLIQTVAENRQPYLTEWIGNFGPQVGSIFISFWIFLIGAVLMFWNMIYKFSRNERIRFTLFFAFMLVAIIYSRYSPSSIFNGQNTISLIFYGAGILTFIGAFIRHYYVADKKGEMDKFKSIRFELLIFISFLFIALISARGFIRLVMILVPPASIAIGYIAAMSIHTIVKKVKNKEKLLTVFLGSILIIVLLFSIYQLYASSKSLASSYAPSPYTQQWQKSMEWVRSQTPTNAVFGHWWDYGYWVQSMGERATALDGGNSIPYWNHLMGRYALTESNLDNTLEFLYAHNITHFLIDSTDIGKYSAFSTIGSNATYDRRSWIPTLLLDNSQTTERKNNTVFVYPGGSTIDEDIKYLLDGNEVFLPEGKAYIAATVLSVNKNNNISEVYGIYFFQDKTYQIPIRYYWSLENGFVDTEKGIEAGVVIYPRVVQNSLGGGDVEARGALLYLSPRVSKTNLARYYLYGHQDSNLELVHSEPDFIVEILKNQGINVGDFVYFNEFRGPIKIWKVNYPSNIQFNQSYLETDYPDSIRLA